MVSPCILQHLKSQFPWSYGLRALFWLLFLAWCLWCHSMLCHFLSRSKWMLQTKLSPPTAYCSTNHKEIFFHWSLCSSRNIAGTIFQVSQISYHFLDHMVCYSSLCCHVPDCHKSILSHQISFSSAVPRTGSLQETTKGLMGNVCVPAFRMLYPSSDTAMAHAHISIYRVKSCMNIWCGIFLFNKKPYHWKLPTQHVFVSHFLMLKYDHMTKAGNVIFILVRDDRWN